MTAITVKYFASLREVLAKDGETLEISAGATVGDIWKKVTVSVTEGSLPPQILCAVNQCHVNFDAQVSDGDEVAFFPPVTGG